MTPEQALVLLDQAVALAPLNRLTTSQTIEAIKILSDYISKTKQPLDKPLEVVKNG